MASMLKKWRSKPRKNAYRLVSKMTHHINAGKT